MKIGFVISVAIVVVAGAAVAIALKGGAADTPTQASSEAALAALTLPTDLPEVFTPSNPDIESSFIYEKAFVLYTMNRSQFERDEPPKELVDQLAKLIIDASNAGKVLDGFLDRHIPVEPSASPDFEDAYEGIATVLLGEAAARADAGDNAGAAAISRGVFAMGYRGFANNTRLYPRLTGLMFMRSTVPAVTYWGEADLEGWDPALETIEEAWLKKIQIVRGVEPNLGDLVKIAQNDGDETFRVEGMLQLGLVQWNPKTSGNERAIDKAIVAGQASGDPLMKQAADAAAATTREDVRRAK